MKLISCYIENFGKLHQFHYEFQDGVNCIIAENGWGKSTLAAFIKAMLFGMEYHTGKKLVDRKKYAPWNMQKFGGYLILEQKGKTYKIERFFGKKEKDDLTIVYDMDFNRKVEGLRENFGEILWQIDRDTFEKTAFLSLGENDLLNEIIAGKLGKEKNQEAGMEESADAVELLDKQLRKVKALRGNGGMLQQVQENKRYLSQEIRLINEDLKKLQNSAENIQIWDEQEQAQWNKLQAFFQKGVPTFKEIEQCSQWVQEHQKYQNREKAKAGTWKKWIGMIMAGTLLIFSSFLHRLPKNLSWIFLLAGSVLLVVSGWKVCAGFILTKQLKNEELRKKELQLQIDRFLGPYRKFLIGKEEDQFLRLHQFVQDYQIMNARYKQALGSEQVQISKRRREFENLILEKENQLAQLKEKEQNLERKYRLLNISKETMIQAKSNFSARFLIPLTNAFQFYLEQLEALNREKYELDIQLHLQVEEYGELHDQAFLSKGTRDLLELCLRFALVEAVYSEKEAPILILDDPFSNLDDHYLETAIDFIENQGKKYQIIYFTCNKSRS